LLRLASDFGKISSEFITFIFINSQVAKRQIVFLD
jgi:hypothetical protein